MQSTGMLEIRADGGLHRVVRGSEELRSFFTEEQARAWRNDQGVRADEVSWTNLSGGSIVLVQSGGVRERCIVLGLTDMQPPGDDTIRWPSWEAMSRKTGVDSYAQLKQILSGLGRDEWVRLMLFSITEVRPLALIPVSEDLLRTTGESGAVAKLLRLS